jgi:hypothetical protein
MEILPLESAGLRYVKFLWGAGGGSRRSKEVTRAFDVTEEDRRTSYLVEAEYR